MWIYFVFSKMQLCLDFLNFFFSFSLSTSLPTASYGRFCVHVQLRRHTLILPNARSLRETPTKEPEEKKKIHYASKSKNVPLFAWTHIVGAFCISCSTIRTKWIRAHTHTHRSPINLFHFDFNRFMGKSFTLPMFKFSWRCALRFWHTHKHTHRIWRCMREKRVFPHARAHSFVCTLCQILLDICYMRI